MAMQITYWKIILMIHGAINANYHKFAIVLLDRLLHGVGICIGD